eukprot:m.55422 g.55422  ORF g.55422 m.55422 type:complete len:148 (-) comp11487_c1_seq2:171-614(-)
MLVLPYDSVFRWSPGIVYRCTVTYRRVNVSDGAHHCECDNVCACWVVNSCLNRDLPLSRHVGNGVVHDQASVLYLATVCDPVHDCAFDCDAYTLVYGDDDDGGRGHGVCACVFVCNPCDCNDTDDGDGDDDQIAPLFVRLLDPRFVE